MRPSSTRPAAGHRLASMLGLAASLALTGCQRAAPPTITPVPAAAPTAEAAGGSEVALAPVPTEQADGEAQFNQFCADCHGQGAMGTDKGPPLVHQLYVPRHAGNAAFVSASSCALLSFTAPFCSICAINLSAMFSSANRVVSFGMSIAHMHRTRS